MLVDHCHERCFEQGFHLVVTAMWEASGWAGRWWCDFGWFLVAKIRNGRLQHFYGITTSIDCGTDLLHHCVCTCEGGTDGLTGETEMTKNTMKVIDQVFAFIASHRLGLIGRHSLVSSYMLTRLR